MPLTYTVDRAKQELRELGINEEQISKWEYKGITQERPDWMNFKSFGAQYLDDKNNYHWICYCPKCQKLRFTTRSACMCGNCETCDYRWCCFPHPPLSLDDLVLPKPLFSKEPEFIIYSDNQTKIWDLPTE